MNKKTARLAFIYCSILLFLFSCKVAKQSLKNFEYPTTVDTETRKINYQIKQTYQMHGISVSNQFAGARLNDFIAVNDTLFQAIISPENTPINPSPWYAFKLWSDQPKSIHIELKYTYGFNRYTPKISSDGNEWSVLNENLITKGKDSTSVFLKVNVSKDTLWIAAQEIEDHRKVGMWIDSLANSSILIHNGNAGVSVQGRPLYFIDIYDKSTIIKPTIVILSRQHPPEVTGYYALKSFLNTIVEQGGENGFLKKFRIMVYPMVNPDGVDLGHWRHNTGGIDLNRDWADYKQQEVRNIANHLVHEVNKSKNNVILGLDFHSTWEDVYYTMDASGPSKIDWFTPLWFQSMEQKITGYDINESSSGLGAPVTKGWFYQQFKAEGITYEIGDRTSRTFIKQKGQVAAESMMKVLLDNYDLVQKSNK